MPDITAYGTDSLTLDYVSNNVKVRFIESDGTVNEYSKGDLDGNSAKETEILNKMGLLAASRQNLQLDYARDGSQNPLDTAAGIYANTWKNGTTLDYADTRYNSNLFLDVTP